MIRNLGKSRKESKKLIKESEGKFAAQYEKANSLGFKKNSVDPFMGVSIGDDDFCVSKTIADEEADATITYSDDWFDGKPGFILTIMIGEEGSGSSLTNINPWSLNTCFKVTRAFEKFAEDAPLTAKFIQKFADEYDLQFDEDVF